MSKIRGSEIVKELYKNYLRSFSSEDNVISEISSDEIQKIVKERCQKNLIVPPPKLFGFENGCPVCSNEYTKNNWIVLHPCGHLLCNDCLSGLNEMIQREGKNRKCPICRTRAKWIGPNDDNLSKFTQQSNGAVTPSRLNLFWNNRFVDNDVIDNEEEKEILLPSKPPISSVARRSPDNGSDISNSGENSNLKDENEEVCVAELSFADTMITIDDIPFGHPPPQSGSGSGLRPLSGAKGHSGDKPLKIGNLSIIGKEIEQEQKIGIDLVIVMDVSGSMSSFSRACISILKECVDSMSSKDRLSIIVFDNNSKQLFPLQPINNENKDEIKRIITNCFSGGSTNFESAIKLLTMVIDDGMIKDRPFKIIFVSDGQPDNGKEGYHLVSKIYDREIKPELYACTFGSDVKADTLQKLLEADKLHFYRHLGNGVEDFRNILKEIGADNNVIIAKNVKVYLKKNITPITVLPIQQEEEKEFQILNIGQIKSGEIINIPLSVYLLSQKEISELRSAAELISVPLEPKEDEIKLYYLPVGDDRREYQPLNYDSESKEESEIKIKILDISGPFILHHFWYKKIGGLLHPNVITKLKNEELKVKDEKLNEIEKLIQVENLGEFYEEIKKLFQETKEMLTVVQTNFHSYNTYSSNVQTVVSYTTPSIQKAYRTFTKGIDQIKKS